MFNKGPTFVKESDFDLARLKIDEFLVLVGGFS